jgi:hypothetical protein
LQTICPGWLRTIILLISASWVARITGMSHQLLALRLSFYVWPKQVILGNAPAQEKVEIPYRLWKQAGNKTKSLRTHRSRCKSGFDRFLMCVTCSKMDCVFSLPETLPWLPLDSGLRSEVPSVMDKTLHGVFCLFPTPLCTTPPICLSASATLATLSFSWSLSHGLHICHSLQLGAHAKRFQLSTKDVSSAQILSFLWPSLHHSGSVWCPLLLSHTL